MSERDLTVCSFKMISLAGRGCKWGDPVQDKAISGHNVAQLSNIYTEAACKAACEANKACKSVDWKPQLKNCSLNVVTKAEVPLDHYPNYVYIELICEGKSHCCKHALHSKLKLALKYCFNTWTLNYMLLSILIYQ